jgi:hypothetical protein
MENVEYFVFRAHAIGGMASIDGSFVYSHRGLFVDLFGTCCFDETTSPFSVDGYVQQADHKFFASATDY